MTQNGFSPRATRSMLSKELRRSGDPRRRQAQSRDAGGPARHREGLGKDPPSRTRRLIGNLEAAPLQNGEVRAKTAFLVFRSHLETDHQLLSGCREDVLRKMNGACKASRRTIVLDANVLLDKNLSVFL